MPSPYTLNPERLEEFIYYMHERESIRLKKEAGAPKPWTKDAVLRDNRFTNVLRENDKTTRWLRQNWTTPHYGENPVTEFLNCAIFRWFGTIEFGQLLGYSDPVDMDRVRLVARDVRTRGHKIFTRAYMITNGGLTGAKEDVVTREYLKPLQLAAPRIVQEALDTCSWEKVVGLIRKVPGHGGQGFMAKEICSDALFTSMFVNGITDRYTWSPVGPGARRGLNRIFGRDIDKNMPEKVFVEEMREILSALVGRLQPHMPQPFAEVDLHTVQFILCEYDKMMRVHDGGRMKNRYDGKS